MDKVLVNVYVPLINVSYDIFIPQTSQLYEVTELIKKAVSDLSDRQFISGEETVLSLRSNGKILDINKTVYELKIINGTKLMLI